MMFEHKITTKDILAEIWGILNVAYVLLGNMIFLK